MSLRDTSQEDPRCLLACLPDRQPWVHSLGFHDVGFEIPQTLHKALSFDARACIAKDGDQCQGHSCMSA